MVNLREMPPGFAGPAAPKLPRGFFAQVSARCKLVSMLGLSQIRTPIFASWLARIFSVLVLNLVWLAFSSATLAQGSQDSNDQRVQELYTDAKAAESRGDLPRAVANYQALLRIAPRLAPAYNNLGSLYLRQREYKKAAEVLERAL